MKKDELLKKIDGLTDEQADKFVELYGNYIPKARFDEVNEAKKNAEALLKERDNQIESLKTSAEASDNLKKEIEKLQGENKKAIEEKDAEIKKIKIDNAVNSALVSSGAKNVKAVLPFLDLEKAEIGEDGLVVGLSDQIQKLKTAEDSAFLFKAEEKGGQKFKGANPIKNTVTGNNTITKEQFAKMGYKARVKLYEEDKELYDALSAENE